MLPPGPGGRNGQGASAQGMELGFFKSLGALSLARLVTTLSQFAVLPVVARLLSVEDFAVMALAMSVVIFTNILSDAGLSRSLVRRRVFDRGEWSSVFWALALLGLVLSGFVALAAPAFARFYGTPALVPVLFALASVPFLQALTAVPNSRLEHSQRFSAIALVHVVAALAGLAAALVLAAMGAGVWALVAQQMVLAAVTFAGMIVAAGWLPLLRLRTRDLDGHMGFGANTVAVSFLFTLQQQAPVLVIGKVLSDQALGLYSMTERFVRLPMVGVMGPVSQVIYVRMARVQDDPARMAAYYVAITRLLAVALIPPIAMLGIGGEAIFAIVLSEKWSAVGALFLLAVPAVAIQSTTSALGSLFMASDRTGLRTRMVWERTAISIFVLAVTVPFGLEAVLIGRSVLAVVYLPRFWAWGRRCAPIDVGAAARALALPAGVSCIAMGLHVVATAQVGLGDAMQMALAMVGAAVAVLISAALTLSPLRDALRLLRDERR